MYTSKIKTYVIFKNMKHSLILKKEANIKLINALQEYIFYSKNESINDDFKSYIIKLKKMNKNIKFLIDDLNSYNIENIVA